MTGKTLVRKLGLADADFATIRSAVATAESRTTGEIALAAIPESSDYSFYELFASVLLGAVSFAVLLPLGGNITTLIDRLFWHLNVWYLPAFYGIASFGLIAIFFLVANVPAIDRLVIPHTARRKAVYERALRHFVESGVYGTRERTGILIFVSWMEREVRIIADSGISAKIEQDEWNLIAQKLASGIRDGKMTEAMTEAVAHCGDLLAEHFPAHEENPNELPDGLFILEAGK